MAVPVAAVGAAVAKAGKIKAIVDQVWDALKPLMPVLITLLIAVTLMPAACVIGGIHLLLNPACDVDPNSPGGVNGTTNVKLGDLNPGQMNSAAAIIATGQKLGIPDRGILIALMTALQESTLRSNLNEGQSDADSAGLFQQRRPWSSNPTNNPSTDPRFDAGKAAAMFFKGGAGGQQGLLDKKGWLSMGLGAAAQAVQVSAFPGVYTKWQGLAQDLLTKLKGNISVGGPADAAGAGSADAAIGVGSCDPAMGGAMEPGNGGLIAPVGNAPKTSPFGRRFHPTLHVWKLHDGQDFGVAQGTPIHAAASGKVVAASLVGGYGNWTCIQHTAPAVKTCYGHQSKINVKVGQTVNQGDVIGLSGGARGTPGAGFSTGSHLHFSVFKNGKSVNPMPYIGKAGSKAA